MKYPRITQEKEKEKIDFSNIEIKVEERLEGEMWSNISGKLEPISKTIKEMRKNNLSNSDIDKKPKK